MAKYNPSEVEPKWQAFWEENRTFATPENLSGPKYYVLDMYPYPSGAGLHVGHPEGYTATDIVARYKRAKGFNVLHPMGWDAFGLPAEQYAIKTGTHPAVTTAQNVANFKRQLKSLGFSYDWDREVNTTDPNYYKWTQWIFLQLYKKGLAYIAEVPVNWCPALGTVLANEEVINGRSERGDHPVIRKPLRQWMLKITEYADRLLTDLEDLDWPESVKEMQRHWIGKSKGAEVDFPIHGDDAKIRVFTTRPDTLFGATYMVLAPEHPLVSTLVSNNQKEAVSAYVEAAQHKSDLERTELDKTKSGVFLGAYAINPVNQKQIPIWVADYVLMSYGTGAIMAVPGHDTRDWEFAKAFDLPIVEVVSGGDVEKEAFTGDGPLVNSDFLDGLDVPNALEKITAWLEAEGKGQATINYKLRDWLFSRQRYWGEPFPIIFDEQGDHHPLPEEQLPLTLPELEDYQPAQTDSPQPPLAKATDWVEFKDQSGNTWRRETNTMPQWAGSCWYYLRYLDPHNDEMAWRPETERYWMPVDLYVGGAEHAVLHLLYARFWHKVLFDAGYVTTEEPFVKLINQGLITAYSFKDQTDRYIHADEVNFDGKTAIHKETGENLQFQVEKMSKAKGNVVNPDEIIRDFGADSFRLYEMFMGPLEMSKPWNTASIEGVRRFLDRAWRLVCVEESDEDLQPMADGFQSSDVEKLYHQTVQGVSEDIEQLRFNTAISKMMVLVNALTQEQVKSRPAVEGLVLLLAPFAPHIAEELWRHLGHEGSVTEASWPTFDPAKCVDDEMTIVVQVNGKKRADFNTGTETSKDNILAKAKTCEKVLPWLENTQVVKEIYVPGKLVNLVVRPK